MGKCLFLQTEDKYDLAGLLWKEWKDPVTRTKHLAHVPDAAVLGCGEPTLGSVHHDNNCNKFVLEAFPATLRLLSN